MSEYQQIHKNLFNKGIDKDVDDKFKSADNYIEGYNIELTSEGKYGSVKNLKGSSLIGSVLGAHDAYNIMGSKNVIAYIDGVGAEECIVFFVATNASSVYEFHIVVYRISTGLFYELYEETVTISYMTGVVDSVIGSEGGIDTLYFVSKLFEPRRLRCYFDIASPTKTSREIELWRRYPGTPLIVKEIIYNPKSSADVGDEHKISYDGSFTTDQTVHKIYEADCVLDVDTGVGDQFTFDFRWQLSQSCSADNATTVYSKIDIQDQSATSIPGFPVTNTLGPGSGPPETLNYGSGIQTDGVTSVSGAYNATPFTIYSEVYITDTTGFYFGRNTVDIRDPAEVAGGDTYLTGSPSTHTITIQGEG